MERELLTRRDLALRLTAELQKYEGCEKCVVSDVIPFVHMDEEGVNWSSSVHIRATGVPAEILGPAYNGAMAIIRARFNIA